MYFNGCLHNLQHLWHLALHSILIVQYCFINIALHGNGPWLTFTVLYIICLTIQTIWFNNHPNQGKEDFAHVWHHAPNAQQRLRRRTHVALGTPLRAQSRKDDRNRHLRPLTLELLLWCLSSGGHVKVMTWFAWGNRTRLLEQGVWLLLLQWSLSLVSWRWW